MTIVLNFNNKTVEILEDVNFAELINFLSSSLKDWEDYTVKMPKAEIKYLPCNCSKDIPIKPFSNPYTIPKYPPDSTGLPRLYDWHLTQTSNKP